MPTEPEVDRSEEALAARRAKLAGIVAGQDNLNSAPLEQNSPQTAPQPLQAPTGRKQRSDAGKPRESFYVSIPGVRFDMNEAFGNEAYREWLWAKLPEGLGDTRAYIMGTVYDLLREIDRLRK